VATVTEKCDKVIKRVHGPEFSNNLTKMTQMVPTNVGAFYISW